jgi:hypothetical protein
MRKLILFIALAVMVAFGSEALAQGPSLEVLTVQPKRIFIPSATSPGVGKGTYVWSYNAKFLCGTISPIATASEIADPLVPGVYLTAVNIRNLYHDRPVVIKKMAVETKSEFEPRGKIGTPVSVELPPMGGLEVDCNDIITILGPLDPNVPPIDLTKQFIKGFVVIENPIEIEVVGVYTAKPSP